MKFRYSLIAAVAGLLSFGSCADNSGFIDAKDTQRTPALNSATLSPLSNESGSVRAYVGTEVSVQGFNLDRIGSVTMDDIEVELTAQSIRELKFKIPALDYAQKDLPYAVRLLAYDQVHAQVFSYDYYVTVPVTDAIVTGYAPAEGTVGTEVTLSGRNLGQITRVRFGSATVEAADFTEVDEAGAFVKFLVPAGTADAPDVETAIAAEWGTETIDVTGEALFWLHIPAFIAPEQAEGVASAIGDELELTGRNLDLVTAVKWGETALVIAEKSPEALKVRFPSAIEQADPVVQAKALAVEYGIAPLVQTAVLAEAWRVDTTPSSAVLTPEFGQMTVEDGKFYLGKTVTVTGANLTAVEGVELQYGSERVAAGVLAGATDSELKFTVPDGVTFDEAQEVSVVALYNGGEQLEIGKATVYPFYYFKGIRLGLGSAVSTYSEFAAENAFFYPDLGRVVSTGEFFEDQLDPYVFVDGGNPAVTSNTINKSVMPDAADYYAVKPYIYLRATSSAFGFAGCANSNSQLKTHCYWYNNKWTAFPSTFGTPIVYYRPAAGSVAFTNLAAAVKDAAITTMSDYSLTIPGAAAPNFSWTESSSAWTKGSVLVCAYVSYEKGAKPGAMTDIAKLGYIYVTDVTCANTGDDKALDDRSGYVEFDMYWSKMQNK
ncbi:MAG: IPT/TIG domain-containing protein [Alistipes sp.]|nr:IPT/TIG domain-containing protein [Alistipes sp.]